MQRNVSNSLRLATLPTNFITDCWTLARHAAAANSHSPSNRGQTCRRPLLTIYCEMRHRLRTYYSIFLLVPYVYKIMSGSRLRKSASGTIWIRPEETPTFFILHFYRDDSWKWLFPRMCSSPWTATTCSLAVVSSPVAFFFDTTQHKVECNSTRRVFWRNSNYN